MKTNQTINIVGLIIFLLVLLWTSFLNVRINKELKKMHSEVLENRRDIHINRNETAKVRAIMISSEYHIEMVPILVPGKSVVPKAILNQIKLQKKGVE